MSMLELMELIHEFERVFNITATKPDYDYLRALLEESNKD